MKTKTALQRMVSLVICLMMAVSLFPAEAVQAAQQALGRENLALNKTVVASGNEVDDGRFTPDLMVDGKAATRWSSNTSDDAWCYIDLGEPTTFNRVKFSWQQRAVHFRLQASNDAENWQDIYTEFVDKENEKAQNTIDFEQPITARYVKMQGILREGTWGFSIYEFEIYNIIKTELEKLMDSIKLEVGDGDTVLALPEKEGFKFEIYGSDNEQVIAPDGTITRPLSDMQVNIMIKGTDLQTGEEVYTEGDRYVTVKGRYADEGENAKPLVAPALREWHGGVGSYVFGQNARVVLDSAYEAELAPMQPLLQSDFTEIVGRPVEAVFADAPETGDVFITLDADKHIGEEGNWLEIEDTLTIRAAAYQGAYWGTRSVLQILKQNADTMSIPKGVARDYPRYEFRGFMLDVSRKFFPMDYLYNVMKTMSWYKMNNLQIHLNDTGGETAAAFRIECETYPGLTSKDGAYTKDEFRTFTKDSLKQGVIITPEFDMPGHAGAFTAYNPELGDGYHLDLTKKDIVYPFLEDLFLEYISGDDPVFVNEDVHIGCDEYGGDSMLYLDFVKHFINFINENGKHPRMWGSFNAHPVPEGYDMPSDCTAYMWNAGQSNALTNLALGFNYISVDDSQLYIVPRGGTAEGSYTDYLRNESLYNNWKVSDHDSIPSAHPSQLGALFACWNDVAGSVRYTSYQVFDRIFPSIPMLAQRTWSQENQVEYDAFKDVTDNVLKAGPGTDIDVHPQANEEGTVLSYDFEDGTAADTSGNGNDGVLNGATVVEDSEKGMVASFDGTGTIETDLRGIQYPYTISMDIKPDETNTSDATLFSSSYEQFHDLPADYKYSFIDGALELKQGANGVLGYTKEWVSNNFGAALTPGVWQNILIQGTEDSMVLYIDGREAGRIDRGSGPVIAFVCPLEMIGENFVGQIDNLSISNKDIPQPRNLALGKTAVSNNSELPDRCLADQVTDGNVKFESRWASAYEDETWIYVDLGEACSINKVVWYWQLKAKAYELQISNDGENWETIYTNLDNTGPTETVETIQLDKSYVTRYVKMNGLERSVHTDGNKYGYCMMEFEVYGDPLEQSNVALGKTAVSSGSELPDRCLADNLTDGNVLFESRWSSEIADKVWVYVDLGEVYAFNKVVWYWQLKAKSYELQISNDGEHWETILTNPDNTGPTETVETLHLDKTYFARYVKMNGLERSAHTDGKKYGYCMMEFEVYRDLLADERLDEYLVNTSLDGITVPEQAKERFAVPVTGLNDIPITWESSDSSVISIDENGAAAVTRGKEDKTVTLTAATASGEASSNRTFTVTVPKLLTALGTMTPETFVDANGTNLPYRLYLPADYDPDRAYPVMLFMHGAGERGTDNALQVTYNVGVIDRIINSNNPDEACIIIAPQVPEDKQWVDTPWGDGSYSVDAIPQSQYMTAVLELLADIQNTYHVDSRRLYAVGISMGGYGAWDIAMRNPGLFAAIMPLCGSADPSKAPLLKDLPVWAFHGSNDAVVPYAGTKEMVEALQAAGNDSVRFTTYPGVGHGCWYNAFEEPELLSWLFAQKQGVLNLTGAPENGSTRGFVTLTAEKEVTWTVNGEDVGWTASSLQFRDEGTYTVTARADGAVSETIVFSIDRTAPVLTASVEHYGITNQDVFFNASEEVTFYNGSEIISEGTELTLTESGTYNIRAIDKAGNYTAFYRVTIMKEAPVLTGAPEGVTRSNIAIRSNVKVLFIVNGVEADDYAYGLRVLEEGKYTVKAVDMAGNESEVSFEIDRTKPTFTASVPSGQATGKDITLTANEVVDFVIDGVTVATGTEYTISRSGLTVVSIYDLAGNYGGVYKANIDKSAPVLSAVIEGTNKAVESGATVKQNVTIKASKASYFIVNDGEPTARANFVKLKASGTYTVKAVDLLGNVSEVFTVTIAK